MSDAEFWTFCSPRTRVGSRCIKRNRNRNRKKSRNRLTTSAGQLPSDRLLIHEADHRTWSLYSHMLSVCLYVRPSVRPSFVRPSFIPTFQNRPKQSRIFSSGWPSGSLMTFLLFFLVCFWSGRRMENGFIIGSSKLNKRKEGEKKWKKSEKSKKTPFKMECSYDVSGLNSEQKILILHPLKNLQHNADNLKNSARIHTMCLRCTFFLKKKIIFARAIFSWMNETGITFKKIFLSISIY